MRISPLVIALSLGLGLSVTEDASSKSELSSSKTADSAKAKLFESPTGRWIVLFDEAPAASFKGFAAGKEPGAVRLKAVSPSVTGAQKYDSRSPEAVAYTDFLTGLHDQRLQSMSQKVGRSLKSEFSFKHAVNGLGVRVSAAEAQKLRAVPGVRAVVPETIEQLDTTLGPQWIKADTLWNGSAGVTTRGEGVVVGVIDSGVNRTHPSFTATSGSYTHINPLGVFKGHCATPAGAGKCSTKVVGLWDFIDGGNDGTSADASDTDGHGTHTASTAVGNPVAISGGTMSGVAPRSNIVAYKACDNDGCPGLPLLKSVDQAVADGVNVINYSISGGPADPWGNIAPTPDGFSNSVTEAFLVAREAGIVVAASAGNSGPGEGTTVKSAPWTMAVGAISKTSDTLASYSSRGPAFGLSLIKPDFVAPGSSIIAAAHDSSGTATLSGTSMASPHAAGAAALLLAARPTWGPSQVHSALMLTARDTVTYSGSPTTPMDRGAGTIDLTKAANAGAYLNITGAQFRAGSIATVHTLNLPGLANANCVTTCTFSRTLTGLSNENWIVEVNVVGGAVVTPDVTAFSLNNGTTQSITFNVDVSNPSILGLWSYGNVTLRNNADANKNLKFPVAIFSSDGFSAPSLLDRPVSLDRGYLDMSVTTATASSTVAYSATTLTPMSKPLTPALVQDPTPSNPYDGPFNSANGTWSSVLTVPLNLGSTPRRHYIYVTTDSATSQDVDLFVGYNTSGSTTPALSGEVCRSVSADATELCAFEVLQPAGAAQRNYWILVQNWTSGSPGGSDVVSVEQGVTSGIASTDGKLTVTGPGIVDASSTYSIRAGWADPTLVDGESRLASVFVAQDGTNESFQIPIRLTKSGDAVTPYSIAPGSGAGAGRVVSLKAGTAHDGLFIDIPSYATSVTFNTFSQSASQDVDLYVARVPFSDTATVAVAPPRGSADASQTNASQSKSITLSGAQLSAGRWYITPVNNSLSKASVTVWATINSVGSVPAQTAGHFYNPSRSGHGIFYDRVGGQRVLVWYAYLQDGTPTWYYAQAADPSPDRGVWTSPIARDTWNGSSAVHTVIGNVTITEIDADNLVFSYNIDGETGSETMTRLTSSCPAGFATNGHWYSPSLSGYGFSAQLFAGSEFYAAYAYDGQGRPRWITSQPAPFVAGTTSHAAYQLSGFGPLETYIYPNTNNPQNVGTLTRTFNGSNMFDTMGLNVTWTNGVPGSFVQSRAVTNLTTMQGCP